MGLGGFAVSREMKVLRAAEAEAAGMEGAWWLPFRQSQNPALVRFPG